MATQFATMQARGSQSCINLKNCAAGMLKNPTPLSRTALIALTCAWITFVANATVLAQFWNAPEAGNGLARIAFFTGGAVCVFLILFIVLSFIALPFRGRAIKWPCILLLISASIVSYFVWSVGMRFDRTMFANVLQTNSHETRELVSGQLLLYVLAVGLLPAAQIWRIPVKSFSKWWRNGVRGSALAACLLVVLGIFVYPQYSRYATATRNHHVAHEALAPINFLVGGISYWYHTRNAAIVRTVVGADAKPGAPLAKPRLVVFVLGETARAQNFSMNGYARATDARMRAANVTYFADTLACGTSTAFSVPCIFSGFSRDDFSMAKARNQETLIDVIKRAGVRTIWLENDGGCKDVCLNSEYEDFSAAKNDRWCTEEGNCHDEILLEGLEARLRKSTTDTFLVLHVKGSHGPAYYKRYPKAFEKFAPTCQTNTISSCDAQSLMNAYDNTIVYTDHVLGETIEILKRLEDQFAPMMLYASDHGESLGENGFFLHGLPNAIAPDVQTRVPMLAWFSPQFLQYSRWEARCINAQNKTPRSHDNIYATLLGALAINTSAYLAQRDIFAPCAASK